MIERLGKIRIVCPCFNEAEGITTFVAELVRVLSHISSYQFEIAFVDDGSSDGTLRLLNGLAQTFPQISVYSLSRNFGHQAALLAGIDTAPLDLAALVMMDTDLQHPPSCIPQMIQEWENGSTIVSMVRRKQAEQHRIKRWTSATYYKLLRRHSQVSIVNGAADFCLLSAPALQAIRQMPERDLFLRGAVAWIGFSRKLVEFDVPLRSAGKTKYSLAKMLFLAKQGFFTFSTSPIQLTFRLGLGFSLLATIYLLYAISMYASDGTVRGWTSLIAVVVFFGGLNLFTLGIMGEYIARTFEEVKQRPRYLFKQTPSDSVVHAATASNEFVKVAATHSAELSRS